MNYELNINNIKKIRTELGISQEDMAEKLGYSSKSGYSMLENGYVSISLERAIKISEVFNKSMEEIFFK